MLRIWRKPFKRRGDLLLQKVKPMIRKEWPEDARIEIEEIEMVVNGLRRMTIEQRKEIAELKEELEQRKMAFDFLQSKVKGFQELVKSLEAELYNQQQFRGPNRDNW